jgi:thiol-disulfide isomerase/thioredoxin
MELARYGMRNTFILVLLMSFISCAKPVEEIITPEVVNIKAHEIPELVASFAGEKAVLLNVWATWCIPCVEEFPYIIQVQNEHKDDLQVVFISADFPEEIDRINQFLRDHDVYWQTYLKDDNDEAFIDAVQTEWTGAIPISVFYNKDGSFLTYFERGADYDEFKELAVKAISNNN